MSFTISPQIRIVALIGVVLVLVAAGGSLMLGRSGSPADTSATKVTVHRHATATHKKTSTTVKSKNGTGKVVVTTSNKGGTHSVTLHATFHVHGRVHLIVPKHFAPRGSMVYSDLPAPLQWQLARHHIVVVSIYSADSNVDAISVAEAHAGATEAGAGFLLVNVLDNSLAGPLTALLPGGGLLPDPGILIYRSPGNIAFRIDGFADRDAVAQAASNAFAGMNSPVTTSTTPAASAAGATTTPTP